MTGLSENELRDAYGMGRHERRQYEDGVGCSCGKEWGHERPRCVWLDDDEAQCELKLNHNGPHWYYDSAGVA